MLYATVVQLIASVPARLLAQLTGTPEPDPVACERALRDASALIDGYLASRYILPLPSVPQVLVGKACDIAIYNLMALRPMGDLEDARARYEDAIRFLEQVAKGIVSLGVPATGPGSEAAPASGVSFKAPPRIMDKSGYWP